MIYQEDEYLMLSGIQHYCYCNRQWALIHMEQVWTDDSRTSAGNIFHQKVDDGGLEKRGNKWVARSIRVSSPTLGLSGICDVLELDVETTSTHDLRIKSIIPVEYKVGGKKPFDCDNIQLCAQAMCLEETLNTHISKGYIFYGKNRRRFEVILDDKLRSKTCEAASAMHETFESGRLPMPITNQRCKRCSLANDCLPEVYFDTDVSEYIKRMEKLT